VKKTKPTQIGAGTEACKLSQMQKPKAITTNVHALKEHLAKTGGKMTVDKLRNAVRKDHRAVVAVVKKNKNATQSTDIATAVASDTDEEELENVGTGIPSAGGNSPDIDDEDSRSGIQSDNKIQDSDEEEDDTQSRSTIEGNQNVDIDINSFTSIIKQHIGPIVKELIEEKFAEVMEKQAEANRLFLENALDSIKNTSREMLSSSVSGGASNNTSVNTTSMSVLNADNDDAEEDEDDPDVGNLVGDSASYTMPIKGRQRIFMVNGEITDDVEARYIHVSFPKIEYH
jgi:hypothetical protein